MKISTFNLALLATIFFLSPTSINSQSTYMYEPSSENPYGLPSPDAPKEIQDYALLIGSNQCTSVRRNADQSWAEPIEMTWNFKYIMNGMAIQDETLKGDGSHSGSIRQYIPDSSKWYVHYYNSAAPSISLPTWEQGKTSDGTIVLYKDQQAPNGMAGYYKLKFYDIDQNGYKWEGAWVNKEETFSFPTWKIDCHQNKDE